MPFVCLPHSQTRVLATLGVSEGQERLGYPAHLSEVESCYILTLQVRKVRLSEVSGSLKAPRCE